MSPTSQKSFQVTKVTEEQDFEVKTNGSAEKDSASNSDIEDTTEETQSLLNKTEKQKSGKKKKEVTLNVAPLATGEVDSLSMPATPRTEVSTVSSKEQVPLLEWEPKEEEVKNLLKKRKVEPVHIVRTVDGSKTQISFSVPFDQVRELMVDDLQSLQVESLSLELQRVCGIGHTGDTSLSILPISMHCSTDAKKDAPEDGDAKEMTVCSILEVLCHNITIRSGD